LGGKWGLSVFFDSSFRRAACPWEPTHQPIQNGPALPRIRQRSFVLQTDRALIALGLDQRQEAIARGLETGQSGLNLVFCRGEEATLVELQNVPRFLEAIAGLLDI
jgi:hypothetical protein